MNADAEAMLVDAARNGDERAYRTLIEPYRGRLRAHCYRMLGSLADADDALQETLLGAWQGMSGFEGRSSIGAWLYTIATHACLRLAAKRARRTLVADGVPAADPRAELAAPWGEDRWVDPYPDDDVDAAVVSPAARYEALESVELAFIAALQRLPATQRAVLILRDVLGFSAEETAGALDTSVASANSALQRARETLSGALPSESQQARRRRLGDDVHRALVRRFIDAWQRADVDAIVAMLAGDATFTMPPLPAWFRGRRDIEVFLRTRVFALRWRFLECRVSGQPAMAAYEQKLPDGAFELEVLNVFSFDGERISAIDAFPNPTLCRRFGLPRTLPV